MTRPSHKPILTFVNGTSIDTVSVFDRGLHYGDGAFETIAVAREKPLLLEQHLQRLDRAADILKIPSPDRDVLLNEIQSLCRDVDRAILKIILTRGAGGRGYMPPEKTNPNRILMLYPWPDYSQALVNEGCVLRICQTRLSNQPLFKGIKHLNRLEQVIARSEWNDEHIFEGLMKNYDDNIIEGTMSNVFIQQNNRLLTPKLDQAGVNGIMRNAVIDSAKALGLSVVENTMCYEDIKVAKECFITNSIIGVLPVRQIEQFLLPEMNCALKIRNHLLKNNMIADL